MSELLADRYRVLSVIGRGGEGSVLRALDVRHERVVALKVRPLRRDGVAADDATLLHEARMLLSLPAHPTLAHARDDLLTADQHVLVLDWVDGTSLAGVLAERGRPGLSARTVLRWLTDAAQGLAVLHRHGLVHGDIKPANLLLDSRGNIVVVDLGSSSGAGASPRGGSSGFRAPEVAAEQPATLASDVYSLAATGYALLSGHAPMDARPPARSTQASAVAQRALRAGLALDPTRRPASVGALVEALAAAIDAMPTVGAGAALVLHVEPRAGPGVDALAWSRAQVSLQLALDEAADAWNGTGGSGALASGPAYAFGSVRAAVAAARDVVEAMRPPDDVPDVVVEVHAGVASGALEVVAGTPTGAAVSRADDLARQAAAGEVLLTAAEGSLLPGDWAVRPVGAFTVQEAPGTALVAVGGDPDVDPMHCPYPGLAAYTAADARLFVGREDVVERALDLLGMHGFVAVVGPSGSGKSSLLSAGLAPRLLDPVLLDPGRLDPTRLGSFLYDPGPDGLGAVLSGAGPRAVLVDQLDELLTAATPEGVRRRFLQALADHGGPLVLALRSDRYAEVTRSTALGVRIARSQVILGALTAADLRQVVVEPSALAGLAVEPGLPEVVLADAAGEPGALPLVSHALHETWRRREGRTLTVAAYTAAGGVRGSLARTADDALADLGPRADLARQRLLRMVSVSADGTVARRRDTLPDPVTQPDAAAVVDALAARRLVTVDGGRVTLAHEALLVAWPTLCGWVQHQRHQLAALNRLREDADRWDASGRHDTDLLRGPRLTAAEPLDVETEHPLVELFVRTSVRRARRSLRRLRALVATGTTLAVLTAASAVIALEQRDDALQAVETTQEQALAIAAGAALRDHPDRALLLAAEAWQRSPGLATAGLVADAVARNPSTVRYLGVAEAPVLAAAASPDGRLVAIGTADQVVVRRAADGDTVRTFSVPDGDAGLGLAFSPDGRSLAVLRRPTKTVEVYAVVGAVGSASVSYVVEEPRRAVFAPSGEVYVLVVGPAGGSAPARVERRDAALRRPPELLLPTSVTSDAVDLAVSPDGSHLALLTAAGRVRIVSISGSTSGKAVQVLPDGAAAAPAGGSAAAGLAVAGLAWSGQVIALARSDGPSLAWRLTDGPRGRPVAVDLGAVDARSSAVSLDGAVAIGTGTGDLLIWSGGTGTPRTMHGHAGPVSAVAFVRGNPTGRPDDVLTTGADGVAALHAPGGGPFVSALWRPDPRAPTGVRQVVRLLDGTHVVVVGSADGTSRVVVLVGADGGILWQHTEGGGLDAEVVDLGGRLAVLSTAGGRTLRVSWLSTRTGGVTGGTEVPMPFLPSAASGDDVRLDGVVRAGGGSVLWSRVVYGTSPNRVFLVPVSVGSTPAVAARERSSTSAMAALPDGRLVSADKGLIMIQDPDLSTVAVRPTAHPGSAVSGLAVSPDGGSVVVRTVDGHLDVYRLPDLAHVRRFFDGGDGRPGLAVAGNGTVVVPTATGTTLFELMTGRRVGAIGTALDLFQANGSGSTDPGGVLAVNQDGDAVRLSVDPAEWARSACRVAARELTAAEVRTYLPDGSARACLGEERAAAPIGGRVAS